MMADLRQETFLSLKNRIVLLFLILLSFAGRLTLCTYALPYATHVDETTIIKDPLKILFAYKNLDFHQTYNLYNWLLILWHGIVFLFGKTIGLWHSATNYENAVALDSPVILFAFRLLNALLSLGGDYIFIRFIYKKLKTSDTIKFLAAFLIVLNPVTFNSISFVKFDAFCYVFYALNIYLGYCYFVEKRLSYRNILYMVLFLGMSLRIELLSFLAGYIICDFFMVHKHSLKSFFDKKFTKSFILSICIYLAITIYPLSIIYNCFFVPKINYTPTNTFEAVVLSHLQWASIRNYPYYIKTGLALLSPVVIFCFLIKLFRKNNTVLFLLPVLIINNIVLAFDYIKDVWYFLLTAVIILFIFILYAEQLKKRVISVVLLSFAFIYFLSYDSELLSHLVKYKAQDAVKKVVLSKTLPGDTILIVGICDLRIPESPQILREQLVALKEVGRSTGYGIQAQLNLAEHDSIHSRGFFLLDSDYFWGGTKYYQRWITGFDSLKIKKLNPKLCIIFSDSPNLDDFLYAHIGPPAILYLKKHYRLFSEYSYTFSDPRLYYKNYYYLHSFFIYTRK